ncbi:MAG: glycosyltransferase family 2 protein [Alphaproteobacteria bacterium]|nr:glycosyltransferase family 2 protein [Alphaproteobacteria bacterium]MCD8566506.1 glycosyltransferase family 2 protein [Alphaproteobacteria bacterium]
MLSVIVPVYNEQDNIQPLIEEIVAVSNRAGVSEIVYVDDGSTDGTPAILEDIKKTTPLLRVIRHKVRAGQSAAFLSGVQAAHGKLIVLMDGDGQNDPRDIETLLQAYNAHANQNEKRMVAGQRAKRQDNMIRKISSRLANKIRAAMLKDGIRDTGCSLKLIRREDYLSLPYFNHMHRYLPALLIRDHVQILTADVSHRPRERGVSKYGFWDRLWVGVYDLIGVRWLLQRGKPQGFGTEEIL